MCGPQEEEEAKEKWPREERQEQTGEEEDRRSGGVAEEPILVPQVQRSEFFAARGLEQDSMDRCAASAQHCSAMDAEHFIVTVGSPTNRLH